MCDSPAFVGGLVGLPGLHLRHVTSYVRRYRVRENSRVRWLPTHTHAERRISQSHTTTSFTASYSCCYNSAHCQRQVLIRKGLSAQLSHILHILHLITLQIQSWLEF
jgi:hypothetical protein